MKISLKNMIDKNIINFKSKLFSYLFIYLESKINFEKIKMNLKNSEETKIVKIINIRSLLILRPSLVGFLE